MRPNLDVLSDGMWIPGKVKIESFAYSESEVHFEWRITDGKSPLEFEPGLRMSDFVQEAKFIKYNCTTEYSTGIYSCLRIGFTSMFFRQVFEISGLKVTHEKRCFRFESSSRLLFDLGLFTCSNVCPNILGWFLDKTYNCSG